MPLSKAGNRERKGLAQRDYRVKVGQCSACHQIAPIHRHHPDYSKPLEVLVVCASCHKKIHMCLAGTQRTTSNPYINPLLKIRDADGNPIYGE